MKISYTMEADESGYSSTLKVDGKDIYSAVFEATEIGAKQVSGTKQEDIEDDALYEILDNFLPYDLHKIARDRE